MNPCVPTPGFSNNHLMAILDLAAVFTPPPYLNQIPICVSFQS